MKIDKITKEISKKKNTDMKILLNKIMTDNIRITAGFLSVVTLFFTLPFLCAAEETSEKISEAGVTEANEDFSDQSQENNYKSRVDSVAISDDRKTIDISVTLTDNVLETYKGQKAVSF